MREHGILQVEFNHENNTVLALEPIRHGERQFWIVQWLENEISTQQLLEKLHRRFQWIEYIDTTVFLESVALWLRKQN